MDQPEKTKMILAQTINQHVLNLPLDKQAEILDFVLFLEQRTALTTSVETNEAQSQAVATLFAALDKARNQNTVGQLCREELYDRAVLHRY
jgi:hypothetical protein